MPDALVPIALPGGWTIVRNGDHGAATWNRSSDCAIRY
jgi:hypothetical protein